MTIYKTEKLGFKKDAPIVYVCVQGKHSAHGETLKEAMEELTFKTADRNVDSYRNMSLDTVKPIEEWVVIYRIITGACQFGTREFLKAKKRKKKYTLSEVLEETKDSFGHDRFAEVVS